MSEVTRRQRIIEELELGPTTVRELATRLGQSMADVVADLGHVERSLRGGRLKLTPSRCESCGFELTKRRRYVAPSRCPRCRSERVSEPELSL